MSSQPDSPSRGFRLGDLVVLLGIGVIVLLLALPWLGKGRKQAMNYECMNNLKQICLATHDYAETYEKHLPPLSGAPVIAGVPRPQSILFTLLPYIEHDNIFKAGMELPSGHTWLAASAGALRPDRRSVKTYVCWLDISNSTTLPTTKDWMGSSYAANAQVFGGLPRVVAGPKVDGPTWNELASEFTIDTIPDGTSNTIFFCERLALAGVGKTATPCAWADPPAGGAGLGNTTNDALGCPLQWFASRRGAIRASVCGPAAFFGVGLAGDPVGAVAGDNSIVPMCPVPEVVVLPAAAALDGRAQSQHREFIYVGMGDGSAHAVRVGVSQVTWARAISPDDGWPLGSAW